MQLFVLYYEETHTFCFDDPNDTILTLKNAIGNRLCIGDWSIYNLTYRFCNLLGLDQSTVMEGLIAKEATLVLTKKMRGD